MRRVNRGVCVPAVMTMAWRCVRMVMAKICSGYLLQFVVVNYLLQIRSEIVQLFL